MKKISLERYANDIMHSHEKRKKAASFLSTDKWRNFIQTISELNTSSLWFGNYRNWYIIFICEKQRSEVVLGEASDWLQRTLWCTLENGRRQSGSLQSSEAMGFQWQCLLSSLEPRSEEGSVSVTFIIPKKKKISTSNIKRGKFYLPLRL